MQVLLGSPASSEHASAMFMGELTTSCNLSQMFYGCMHVHIGLKQHVHMRVTITLRRASVTPIHAISNLACKYDSSSHGLVDGPAEALHR